MKVDQAIKEINHVFNITLSKEQEAVLRAPIDTPLLVNACAGSGKTTLFLYSIITRALTNKQNPENVLGITFSKKAQTDMENRYNEDVEKLTKNPATHKYNMLGKPMFVTFHALFYRLLRMLPEFEYAQVLPSYGHFFYQLSQPIDLSATELSKQEYLTEIFDAYDMLINMTYSDDGLTLNQDNKIIKFLREENKDNLVNIFAHNVHFTMDDNFIPNYVKVIETYQKLKTENGYVDFSDMKIKLKKALQNADYQRMLNGYMSRFEQVYIDEFQDIDPLQWILIKQLLPKANFDHLFAIGDDDQAIYSFRGSSPYYILNFTSKLLPSAKRFDLSTNYRTGGRILETARPFIEQNTARLGKDLNAFNKKQGVIHIYTGVDWNGNQDFFKKLNETAGDEKANSALLVRLNKDKTLIADELASLGYYTNLTQTSLILQNQSTYKAYINIMDAIIHNDAYKYMMYSSKIAFSAYQNLLKEEYNPDIKLDELITNTYKNVEAQLKVHHTKRDYYRLKNSEKALKKTNEMLIKMVNYQHDKIMQKFNPAGYLTKEMHDLLKSYQEYMVKKQIYSKNAIRTTMQYIENLVQSEKKWETFLTKEQIKKDMMTKMIKENKQRPNIQVMSMHQSKGLEFDDVFIYGLGDDLVNKERYQISKIIPANMDLPEFTQWLADHTETNKEQLVKLLWYLYQDNNELAKNMLAKAYGVNTINKGVHGIIAHLINNKCFDYFDLGRARLNEHGIRRLYYDTHTISDFVEEERRLLYVALTRAKKNTYLAYPTEHVSPLANELINIIGDEQDKGNTDGIDVHNNDSFGDFF